MSRNNQPATISVAPVTYTTTTHTTTVNYESDNIRHDPLKQAGNGRGEEYSHAERHNGSTNARNNGIIDWPDYRIEAPSVGVNQGNVSGGGVKVYQTSEKIENRGRIEVRPVEPDTPRVHRVKGNNKGSKVRVPPGDVKPQGIEIYQVDTRVREPSIHRTHGVKSTNIRHGNVSDFNVVSKTTASNVKVEEPQGRIVEMRVDQPASLSGSHHLTTPHTTLVAPRKDYVDDQEIKLFSPYEDSMAFRSPTSDKQMRPGNEVDPLRVDTEPSKPPLPLVLHNVKDYGFGMAHPYEKKGTGYPGHAIERERNGLYAYNNAYDYDKARDYDHLYEYKLDPIDIKHPTSGGAHVVQQHEDNFRVKHHDGEYNVNLKDNFRNHVTKPLKSGVDDGLALITPSTSTGGGCCRDSCCCCLPCCRGSTANHKSGGCCDDCCCCCRGGNSKVQAVPDQKVHVSGPVVTQPRAGVDIRGPSVRTKASDVKIESPKLNTNIRSPRAEINGPRVRTTSPELKVNSPKLNIKKPNVKLNSDIRGPDLHTTEASVRTRGPTVRGPNDIRVEHARVQTNARLGAEGPGLSMQTDGDRLEWTNQSTAEQYSTDQNNFYIPPPKTRWSGPESQRQHKTYYPGSRLTEAQRNMRTPYNRQSGMIPVHDYISTYSSPNSEKGPLSSRDTSQKTQQSSSEGRKNLAPLNPADYWKSSSRDRSESPEYRRQVIHRPPRELNPRSQSLSPARARTDADFGIDAGTGYQDDTLDPSGYTLDLSQSQTKPDNADDTYYPAARVAPFHK